jgi:hypothetical protein
VVFWAEAKKEECQGSDTAKRRSSTPCGRRKGKKVAEQAHRLIELRGITSDNGAEFTSRAMDTWAHQAGVTIALSFNRPRLLSDLRLMLYDWGAICQARSLARLVDGASQKIRQPTIH